MTTPEIQLQTLFQLTSAGRIVSTREPGSTPGPLFTLVRNSASRVWAVRADVPDDLASELDRLASAEPPIEALQDAPVHADRYAALCAGQTAIGVTVQVHTGPAFTFPGSIELPSGIVTITDEGLLGRHFHGWVPGEIAAGRAPVMAVLAGGFPVSVCFCARRSDTAAEAGLKTTEGFRGRGLGPRVTAAWALAVRESGRIPLYSTEWNNAASLSVARKLGLAPFASDWSLYG